jgi:TRAP transporter 4TM/12TM fusion protein
MQIKILNGVIGASAAILVGLTLYTAYFGVFPDGIQRSAHLLLVFVLVYAMAFRDTFDAGVGRAKLLLRRAWIVIALGLAVIAVGHQLVNFDAINARYGAITQIEVFLGIGLVIGLFDACRRRIGLAIVILAALFILYGLYGRYLPAPFGHRGYSLERIASQVYLGGGGIFGTPLGVSATFVTGVVALGALLERTGAGRVLMDFATALTGHLRGGPAKAAVVGSSLMGMISGTAVANVLTTGPISIPMMQKSGYRRESAGAIEAVSSTGGQLMPPVMGAAAFIMAEFTSTSYLEIVKAAFLPAVVFYVVLFAMVHFEAVRERIPILRQEGSVTDWSSIRRGSYLLIPLPVFVIMLIGGYSIMLGAFWAVASSVAVSYFSRDSAMTPRRLIEASVAAANAVVPVALACAAAGIIIGVITLTGVGLKFSTIVVGLSGGSLPVALVLTMLTCLVLGMGLPTAAAYILVATLVAPALVNMGVGLLAAHMFVLYSAMLSAITPPVALAAYAAASIAQANPMKVAFFACKFGVAAFAIPFFFVFDPAILGLGAAPVAIAGSFATAVLGGVCASAAIIGCFARKLNAVERIGFAGAALLFLSPDWRLDLAACAVAGAIAYLHIRKARITKEA